MSPARHNPARPHCYHLHFRSLFDEGRGFVFPCDERGRVDLNSLGQRAQSNYLYARHLVGREFGLPSIEDSSL